MTQTAALDPQPSIASTRRALAQSFRRHGLSTPELDARLLVAHALGLDHATLAADAARILSATEAAAIAALAARRHAREPVARIIGVKEFWGLDFKLDAATLVPRPETETVVEAALAALDRLRARDAAFAIADLGTGSGALLLALLSELPMARGFGTDRSVPALRCARANAAALGLGGRASFLACDYGAALEGPFDLVVSNPPYVARGDIAALATSAFNAAFRIGLQLSAPFLVFGLVFNIGLGVLARLMPQMQVYFVGVPLSIFAGLLILAVVLAAMMGTFMDYFIGVMHSLMPLN